MAASGVYLWEGGLLDFNCSTRDYILNESFERKSLLIAESTFYNSAVLEVSLGSVSPVVIYSHHEFSHFQVSSSKFEPVEDSKSVFVGGKEEGLVEREWSSDKIFRYSSIAIYL